MCRSNLPAKAYFNMTNLTREFLEKFWRNALNC